MFRSRARPVVYPQLEHARLSAVVAAAWGNEQVPRPPLPFDSFVRGVAVHDRGYGELDDDPLLEIPEERWLEIMRRGFAAQDDDPVVDLVVALHIRRLVAGGSPASREEFEAEIPARLEAAGVSEADAHAADDVTNLCDRLAFSFCFEQEGSGSVGGIEYAVRADGAATLAPWPLAAPALQETVVGYAAERYPCTLEPVERVFSCTT